MSLLKRLKSQIGYGGGGSLHHTTLFRSKSLEGVPVSHILDDPHFTITAGRDMILEFVNSQEVPWSPKEDCVFTIIEFLYSFSPKMVCSQWKNDRRCRHAVNTVAGVHRVVISARYASTFRCVASSGSQVARNGRK